MPPGFGAKVILVAFFGKGDLRELPMAKSSRPKSMSWSNACARPLPVPEMPGSCWRSKNYLDAAQNLEILRRVGSDADQVYYDVYNTGITRGYDVPGEIRLLKGRIAQFHFKNGPQFLGQGKLQLEPILAAMKEVGYQGWIVLEDI